MTSLHSEYEQLYPTHPNDVDLEMYEDNGRTTCTSVSNAIESTTSSLALQDTGQREITHLSMDKSSEEEHPQQQTSCTADTLSDNPQEELVSTWKENDSTAESSALTYISEDITEGTFITTASGRMEESSIEDSSLFSTDMSDKLSHSNVPFGYVELNNEGNTSLNSATKTTTSSLALQDAGQTSITHLSMDKLLEEDHSQQLTSCTARPADTQSGNPYTQGQLMLNWKGNTSTTESSFLPYLSENATESTFITTASGTMDLEESSVDLFSTCNMPDKLSLSNPPSGYVDLNHNL